MELREALSGVGENSLDCLKRERREREVPLAGLVKWAGAGGAGGLAGGRPPTEGERRGGGPRGLTHSPIP